MKRWIVILALWAGLAHGGEWSGYVAGELRLFPQPPLDGRQHGDNLSLAFEPQYSHTWDGGYQSFAFVPFVRLDGSDGERSHLDIRELTWVKAAREWELRLGVRKLFWGVTESRHLVDIINQSDGVENPDGEDKLGQPLLNLALIRDWGTLDLFLLPGFRERTFPGAKGRLRSPLPVDTDQARYQSGAAENHVDWAVRWSRSVDVWDLALSHFSGTNREPELLPGNDGSGRPVLVPYYEQIDQTGLELQATLDSWLWKLEAISRDTPRGRFSAFTGGFEQTRYGVFGSAADLGMLLEYSHDDRGDAVVMGSDLLLGVRLTLNDVQSSELLAGVVEDLSGGGRAFNIEASRRFGDAWKLNLELRAYDGAPPADPLHGLRRDDYLQLELARYF